MLGDIGQPDGVEVLGVEVALDQVVVDWWAGLARQATFLGEHRPDLVLLAEALHTVGASNMATTFKLISNEPIPEGRVVTMNIKHLIDQMGVVPVPIRIRPGPPL